VFVASLEALGDVRANESVEVRAARSDHIDAIHFDDGQEVDTGDLLLELNAEEERAALAEARAILEDRQLNHQRAMELAQGGIASERELETASSLLRAAEARVASLEAAVADREIRAPFSGSLGLRQVSVGSYIDPSTVVTTLDDLSVVKTDFTIPETWLAAVAVGMRIVARSDAWPDHTFDGTIRAIDTRIDPATRAVAVRGELPNPERRLRPGMLLKIAVERDAEPVLQIPEAALVPVGDRQFVFRVDDDDVAERVEVTLGRRRVGAVEILDGLRAGDRVVIEGLVRVRPDLPVIVVAERTALHSD
jgi:membrane fusion protein (multidrug efflux system)